MKGRHGGLPLRDRLAAARRFGYDSDPVLLSITTTHTPATDLGFLLHKHPGRVQSFDLSFGRAHIFYARAEEAICTACLLLDVDPIALVRGRPGSSVEGALDQYVNDRPYVASSFLSVAVGNVFGTALSGRCALRPELVDTTLPLEAALASVPCRGGEDLLRRLFEPLGYQVNAANAPLDSSVPEWGSSRSFQVTLRGEQRLKDLLAHLYVLIPVLDDQKHYYFGEDEVEKLLRRGEGWLQSHPERELIARRYLLHRRTLADLALARLLGDEMPDPDQAARERSAEEETAERTLSLNEQRMGAVVAALRSVDARRILDLGCGEGRLIGLLLQQPEVNEIVGMDVSHRALEFASRRLRLDRMPAARRERVKLFQGSLIYNDPRLHGYDAAAVIEVIEHLDLPRLQAFERVLFERARPGAVVLTTPNAEYNVRWPSLPAGRFRHRDHRFEWSRSEFRSWGDAAALRFGYLVRYLPVGPDDPDVGPPTQMALFTRSQADDR